MSQLWRHDPLTWFWEPALEHSQDAVLLWLVLLLIRKAMQPVGKFIS